MMRSKWMQNLLRTLIALLGAGIGAAVTLGVVQVIHMANPSYTFELGTLVAAYMGSGTIGFVLFFLLGRRLLQQMAEIVSATERVYDKLTLQEFTCRIAGLICGLLIATLVTQILHFMGDSLVTTVLALIIYVICSAWGYVVGRKRANEVTDLMNNRHERKFRIRRRKKQRRTDRSDNVRLLDSSVLIDGRLLAVCRLGFLDGELIVPDFVVEELQLIADHADSLKRAKGRRGLDMLAQLQTLPMNVRTETTNIEGDDVDVKLLRMAKKLRASIVTDDYNLGKAAHVSGIRVLNLNELASALRPVVAAGDTMDATIVKAGKEPGQGIAYTEDGTMIVVDGGRNHLDQTIPVVVTSALQTNAGRMIFAKMKESA